MDRVQITTIRWTLKLEPMIQHMMNYEVVYAHVLMLNLESNKIMYL